MMTPAIRAIVCRSIALGACLLLALAAASGGPESTTAASQAASAPARGIGSAPASQPGGAWSCWTVRWGGTPRAATPEALWLAPYETGWIWRFDRKTEKLQAFGVMDGLPLEEGNLSRLVAASDERCAIVIERIQSAERGYIWSPKEGWRLLPAVDGNAMLLDLGFDPADRLLALFRRKQDMGIYELVAGKWKEFGALPIKGSPETIIPLAEGPVVWMGSSGSTQATFFPYANPANVTVTKGPGMGSYYARPTYFRAGGKTFCFLFPNGNWATGNDQAYEMRTDGFSQYFKGDSIGPDLKAGGFISYKVVKRTEDVIRLRSEGPDEAEVEVRPGESLSFEPFRDIDGRLWWGARRWDGKRWEAPLTKWEFPGTYSCAHRSDRVRLAKDGLSWLVTDPDIPLNATGYDPANHTWWDWIAGDDGKGQLRLLKAAGGKVEIVRTLPFKHGEGRPQIKTADGDWWWHTPGHVYRLTASGVKQYTVDNVLQIALSPKGNICTWSIVALNRDGSTAGAPLHRYDAKTDNFVAEEAWEEFAFTLGKLRLSYIPPLETYPAPPLYCKQDGQWEPFRTPYVGGTSATVAKDAVHGDKLLVTVPSVGVLEYNGKLDQWVRLVDAAMKASFDAAGRRILSGHCVLVYDGDPWAGLKVDDDDDPVFARLLKQMDDDSWKVREEATTAMAKDFDKYRNRIINAAVDQRLSEEVRTRLKGLLPSETSAASAAPPPPLFRTMHPLLTQPK